MVKPLRVSSEILCLLFSERTLEQEGTILSTPSNHLKVPYIVSGDSKISAYKGQVKIDRDDGKASNKNFSLPLNTNKQTSKIITFVTLGAMLPYSYFLCI